MIVLQRPPHYVRLYRCKPCCNSFLIIVCSIAVAALFSHDISTTFNHNSLIIFVGESRRSSTWRNLFIAEIGWFSYPNGFGSWPGWRFVSGIGFWGCGVVILMEEHESAWSSRGTRRWGFCLAFSQIACCCCFWEVISWFKPVIVRMWMNTKQSKWEPLFRP